MVNRRLWIEGLLLLAISFVSIFESIRLIIYKNPQIIYDLLGPGYYLLFLSIALLIVSIFYIYFGKQQPIEKQDTSKKMRIRLISTCFVFVLYTILMMIIGYGTATFIFFILMFRIVEIRPWYFNFLLSVLFTTGYYLLFGKYAGIVFPRGILF